MLTIFDMFESAAKINRKASCVCVPARSGRSYLEHGLDLNYGEVLDKVLQLKNIYQVNGYGIGHRVGLMLDSRPEIFFHFLALNSLGASIVPLNPDNSSTELNYAIDFAKLTLIVSLEERVKHIYSAIHDIKEKPLVVISDRIFEEITSPQLVKREGKPDRSSEAAIVYTSGTTAAPKACILTNEYGFFAGKRYLEAGGLISVEYGKERLFNPLPLFYVNSLMITSMAMIQAGGCMIFPDRFHSNSWWKDIISTRATIIQYLGIVMPALLSLPPCEEEKAHSIKFAVGAGIDPSRHQEAELRFGFPLCEVWGMTEVAIASISCNEPRHIETRAIGRPLPGMEFKIIDPQGKKLDPEVPGELLVRSTGEYPRHGLVAEYLNNHQATEDSWLDGWFHTGDLVVERIDGTFCFIERIKDLIRRSGQNIASSDVESALYGHPAIAQAVAIPIKEEIREEEVMACIVLQKLYSPTYETAEIIFKWAQDRISYYKLPGWIFFVEAFPVTHTQKILKRSIFPSSEDPKDKINCFDMRALKKQQRH